MSESIESLLEFLRISSRVSVVQLEPPRARSFAEALARHLADRSPLLADAIAERDDARAAAKRWQTAFEAQNHARSFDLHRERDAARAERDLAQRAAAEAEQHKVALSESLDQMTTLVTHWEGVAAANALDVVTEVAKEREACAKLCDDAFERWRLNLAQDLATDIRARGLSGTPQLDDVKRCGA
jgi:hypothetical protein